MTSLMTPPIRPLSGWLSYNSPLGLEIAQLYAALNRGSSDVASILWELPVESNSIQSGPTTTCECGGSLP